MITVLTTCTYVTLMYFADNPQKHQHVNDAIEMESKSVENNKPDKPLPYSGTMMTEVS